jgi:benzylsuccinate CoA-transferase BbsF subunit
VARSLGGESIRACGNGDGEHCPQGGYRCAGDDRWIALSVVDDASWSGLCALLDRIDWSNAIRRCGGVAATARPRSTPRSPPGPRRASPRKTMFSSCNRRGCRPGLRTMRSRPRRCASARARCFVDLTHPEVGIHPVYAPIWRLGRRRGVDRSASADARRGQRHALRELLGLPDGEIDALVAAKVVY